MYAIDGLTTKSEKEIMFKNIKTEKELCQNFLKIEN